MMKTVCSHTKVQSMLADVESHSNLNTVMKKLVAMTKALALFVRRIQSEFQEYSDIAEPFLFALFQVGSSYIHLRVRVIINFYCRYLKV